MAQVLCSTAVVICNFFLEFQKEYLPWVRWCRKVKPSVFPHVTTFPSSCKQCHIKRCQKVLWHYQQLPCFQNDDNETLLIKKLLVSLFGIGREGAHKIISGPVRLAREKHTANNKCWNTCQVQKGEQADCEQASQPWALPARTREPAGNRHWTHCIFTAK